jgi:sarcosine oxidase, subunit beta
MQTADVVIAGGGIVGSSIACHLAASGCRNLLVIERESAQGKGSPGKSMVDSRNGRAVSVHSF